MMDFYFPPRPEEAIMPIMIPFYERKGYVAQIKKNGTCTVTMIDRNKMVTHRTRHNEPHKAWTPTEDVNSFFAHFADSVFVSELLHSKGGGVRNTMYIFDVLRFQGQDLTGKTLQERLELIDGIVPFTSNVMIADTYGANLKWLYQDLSDPLDEGIVLKNPNAPLAPCYRAASNTDWQVKCRRPKKMYGF